MVQSPARREAEGDFVPRLGAGCLMLLGGSIVAMGMVLYFGRGRLDILGGLFYLAVGAGFLGTGLFWFRYAAQQERARRDLFEEKSVLSVAARHGGYATTAQITLETQCTAAEVEEAVARLCRQGLARAEFDEDGAVRYRFGGLIGRGQ